MSINKVCVSGNLGRDPELRSTASGMQVCTLSVCVNDRRHDKQQDKWVDKPNWIRVVFFGNRAESICRYLGKGSLVFVSGKLSQNTWKDKETGKNRSAIEVIGDDIQFANRSEQSGQQQAEPEYEGDVYDEDIPF